MSYEIRYNFYTAEHSSLERACSALVHNLEKHGRECELVHIEEHAETVLVKVDKDTVEIIGATGNVEIFSVEGAIAELEIYTVEGKMRELQGKTVYLVGEHHAGKLNEYKDGYYSVTASTGEQWLKNKVEIVSVDLFTHRITTNF